MFRFEEVDLVRRVNGANLPVLKAISCEIIPRKITALIGPSGAGKSSLLRLMNRLEDPNGGRIYFQNQLLSSYDILDLRRRVGMVFQIPVMFSGTAGLNIHYAANFRQPAGELKPVRDLLRMVGLDPDLEQRNAEQLSVGQQQRVSIARTLANNPEVLLLDEPTASLDPASATGILHLMKELQVNLGLTVVFITHLLEQAKNYTDYTGFLENGSLIEFNQTAELFNNPRHSRTRNFLAGGEYRR